MIKILFLSCCLTLALAQSFIVGNSYTLLNQQRIASFNADGLAAVATYANRIGGVVEAANGDIYFGDWGNCRIRKISALTKVVTTIAGNGLCEHTGNGGLAIHAGISRPVTVAIDPADNNIVFGEYGADTIRKVNLQTGVITLIVASVNRRCGSPGDGGLAVNAALCLPSGISYDSNKHMFIADSYANRIRRVDAITTIITTVAGAGFFGFNGDTVALATMTNMITNAVPFNGQVFFTDQENSLVRKVNNNFVNTIAGIPGVRVNANENILAAGNPVNVPGRLDMDAQGNIFFMESHPSGSRVRKIDAQTGLAKTVAGGGGNTGTNISAIALRIVSAYDAIVQVGGLFVETDGDLLIADTTSIYRVIGVAAPDTFCGNGIVETGEDCDSSNPCCTANCKFQPSTQVCRAVAGPCDKNEFCTGTSDLCPSDQFAPSSTLCGQSFGVCEIGIPTSCSGTSAFCPSIPSSLNLFAVGNVSAASMPWSAFSLVSFANIHGKTGRLNGRIAAKTDISLGNGFSVADNLNNYFDPLQPYSLVSGRDLKWGSGALYPNFNLFFNGAVENGFVGGNTTIPSYLESQIVSKGCSSAGCLNADFSAFETYLSNTIQPYLASLKQNVVSFVQYSGLMIECTKNTDPLYVLNTDAATIKSVTWYSTRGCNGLASWVINIKDEAKQVAFAGDSLPTISERTVWNILGSGRTIKVTTQVNGNILSPKNTLSQTGGTINGQVYVANVSAVLDIAVVRCAALKNVIVTDFLKIGATIGSNTITVLSGGNVLIGDTVTIGVDTFTIIAKQSNADGSATLTLSGTIKTAVTPFAAVKFSANPTVASRTDNSPSLIANSGSALCSSIFLIFFALLLLL